LTALCDTHPSVCVAIPRLHSGALTRAEHLNATCPQQHAHTCPLPATVHATSRCAVQFRCCHKMLIHAHLRQAVARSRPRHRQVVPLAVPLHKAGHLGGGVEVRVARHAVRVGQQVTANWGASRGQAQLITSSSEQVSARGTGLPCSNVQRHCLRAESVCRHCARPLHGSR